jgi:hypothetical protein
VFVGEGLRSSRRPRLSGGWSTLADPAGDGAEELLELAMILFAAPIT